MSPITKAKWWVVLGNAARPINRLSARQLTFERGSTRIVPRHPSSTRFEHGLSHPRNTWGFFLPLGWHRNTDVTPEGDIGSSWIGINVARARARAHTHTHLRLHVYLTRTHTHTRARARARARMCVCVCVCTYTYIKLYIYKIQGLRASIDNTVMVQGRVWPLSRFMDQSRRVWGEGENQ